MNSQSLGGARRGTRRKKSAQQKEETPCRIGNPSTKSFFLISSRERSAKNLSGEIDSGKNGNLASLLTRGRGGEHMKESKTLTKGREEKGAPTLGIKALVRNTKRKGGERMCPAPKKGKAGDAGTGDTFCPQNTQLLRRQKGGGQKSKKH